jgi:type VI protein secretion system component VasF
LKVCPAAPEFDRLTDFAADCIYEIVMNYPADAMRAAYREEARGRVSASAEKLKEFGYSDEQIKAMRGR